MAKSEPPATIQVKQMEEEPIAAEVLAESVEAIAKGFRALMSSRLSRKAIEVLILNAAPKSTGRFGKALTIKDVRNVLDGIDSLERTYLKPK